MSLAALGEGLKERIVKFQGRTLGSFFEQKHEFQAKTPAQSPFAVVQTTQISPIPALRTKNGGTLIWKCSKTTCQNMSKPGL